jgi:general secretion pathway protein K
LLAVLATALISVFRSDVRILSAQAAQQQAIEAAKAGINLAVVGLSDPHSGWAADGTSQRFQLGDATLEVTILAESGKIDLNTGDPDLLRGLLTSSGISPGAADKFTAAIEERRAEGSRPEGQGPFERIEELMEIPEMTRDVYERLAPSLTVYSGSSTVDLNVAPADVILAIPGNTEADVEAAMRSRTGDSVQQTDAVDLSKVIGHSFSIMAIARLPDKTVARRKEIVRFTGDPKEPVWVLVSE